MPIFIKDETYKTLASCSECSIVNESRRKICFKLFKNFPVFSDILHVSRNSSDGNPTKYSEFFVGSKLVPSPEIQELFER